MLNSCQKTALKILDQEGNSFLTGVAGSGKSFLVREFLKKKKSKTFPILASTGASAILVGGRTFHSFFGLGIMQGGPEATMKRALQNKKLVKRLKTTEGVIIDEISMISGQILSAAEMICRLARESDKPWGGLKTITVGDFAQLPPVNPYGREKDWAFLDFTWTSSKFNPAVLKTIVRTEDKGFVEILNSVRAGKVSTEVTDFLNERKRPVPADFEGTRLFAHRETAEKFNREQLEKVSGPPTFYDTVFSGDEKYLNEIKKNAPVPDTLVLKVGALVMIRQNDPQGRWVNGSLGSVLTLSSESVKIGLLAGGTVNLEKVSFSILNAEGKEVASAMNFPLNLAYASTIHKAQGLTLDRVAVDLKNLWEPGQAYVAMSRVRKPSGMFILDWSPGSIKSDPAVSAFNAEIWKNG